MMVSALGRMGKRMRESYLEKLAPYIPAKEYFAENPILRYFFIELTNQCNLNCLHCGSSCPSVQMGSQVEGTVLERLIDEIAEHVKPGEMMFCLTGGEPLLRTDWAKIGAYISAKGYSWGMTTNGTLITDAVIEQMRNSGMDTIAVSLDGMEENHEWLRSKKGCFQRVVEGIRRLVASKAFQCVQVTTVVNQRNLDELETLYGFLRKLGVQSWKITGTEPIGAARNREELFLTSVQYKQLLDFILEKRKIGGMEVSYGCSHFLPEKYDNGVRSTRFHCGAGTFIASVSAEGDILACLDIDSRAAVKQGNIYQDSFWDVWNNGFQIFRNPRNLQNRVCQECVYRGFCRGDSWHTWDFEKEEPQICMIKYLEKEEGFDGKDRT